MFHTGAAPEHLLESPAAIPLFVSKTIALEKCSLPGRDVRDLPEREQDPERWSGPRKVRDALGVYWGNKRRFSRNADSLP